MTTWESFITRRRINVEAFIIQNGLRTKEIFLSHLDSRGIQPPSNDVINALFPPVVEVKVETKQTTEEKERAPEESSSPPRSDSRKGGGNSGASRWKSTSEDRSNEDTGTS